MPEKYVEDIVKRATKALRAIQENETDDETKVGFITELFGYEAKLKTADYIHEITNQCAWVFTPEGIRTKFDPFMEISFLEEYEENIA